MDLQIREFQNTVEVFIQNFDLPIEVKRLAMQEIMERITKNANNEIKFQILEREEAEKALAQKESEVKTDAENV